MKEKKKRQKKKKAKKEDEQEKPDDHGGVEEEKGNGNKQTLSAAERVARDEEEQQPQSPEHLTPQEVQPIDRKPKLAKSFELGTAAEMRQQVPELDRCGLLEQDAKVTQREKASNPNSKN